MRRAQKPEPRPSWRWRPPESPGTAWRVAAYRNASKHTLTFPQERDQVPGTRPKTGGFVNAIGRRIPAPSAWKCGWRTGWQRGRQVRRLGGAGPAKGSAGWRDTEGAGEAVAHAPPLLQPCFGNRREQRVQAEPEALLTRQGPLATPSFTGGTARSFPSGCRRLAEQVG